MFRSARSRACFLALLAFLACEVIGSLRYARRAHADVAFARAQEGAVVFDHNDVDAQGHPICVGYRTPDSCKVIGDQTIYCAPVYPAVHYTRWTKPRSGNTCTGSWTADTTSALQTHMETFEY